MNYYQNIKDELIKNDVNRRVKTFSINRSDLETYYKVGELLSEAGNKYGESIIKKYSMKLTSELGKGYSERNLRNIRQFYYVNQKWQTVSAKLTWSHYCEVLWFNEEKYKYYIDLAVSNNLSVRELRDKIKSKEYERLPESTKNKLINNEEINIQDTVKNPIIINNPLNTDVVNELILHKLILENIESFMSNLGEYYSFIGSEYKIKIGNRYNYIDLLLFNIEFNCYVVVELKVTELRKEYIGQIEIYMNYIDDNLKRINQNKTLGIIICKINNEFIVKYSSNERIIAREYIIQ